MTVNNCPNCGSSEFTIAGGYRICKYCDSKFLIEKEDSNDNNQGISLQEDVKKLLKKCIEEPWNAKRYANLILDIDPTNQEAKQYLMKR